MAEMDRDRELLIEQLRRNASERGGVTGGSEVQGSLDQGLAPEAVAPPAAAPVATPAPSYAMRGFEADKLAADPAQQTEKYKMGNIFKKYDPKGGVTPEMLAELNALGIAEFSGQGDKLTVNNTKNDPRFGRGGTADVVYGIKGQNADTAWQPWFIDDGGAGASAAGPSRGMGAPMMGGGGGESSFAALAPTDTGFFQRLQQQAGSLLGGPQAFDREALLRMLGA
jgi:hypothetical protein